MRLYINFDPDMKGGGHECKEYGFQSYFQDSQSTFPEVVKNIFQIEEEKL